MSFNSSFSQLPKQDIEDFHVKGIVKSLKEITYNAIDRTGTIVKGKISTDDFVEGVKNYKHNFFVLFDNKGNKLQYDEYTTPFSPSHTEKYIYINKRLVSQIGKMFFSVGNWNLKSLYKYDIKGNKIEESVYKNSELIFKYVYKNRITANGKEVEMLHYDSDGYISKRYSKEYNLKGMKVKDIEYNSDGEEKSAMLYKYNDKDIQTEWTYRWNDESGKGGSKLVSEYDNNGKVIFVKRYDLTNKLEWIQKYKYNKDELIVGLIFESPDGLILTEYIFVYENKKKVQEKVVDVDGVKLYKYNDLGDVIEYEEKTANYLYDYTYDKKGNWTKIIEYRNTIPILIKERTISYYDTLNKNIKKTL